MNLHTDYPYPLLRKGIINSYPSARENFHCDVAVIGAGITGALIAYHLCRSGVNAAVFDKRHAGMGSTAASTSLLQYEIDIPLRQLIQKVGEKNAVRSYLLCQDAIVEIGKISKRLGGENTFSNKPSFQFASFQKDVKNLEAEYQLRKKAGFNVEWFDKQAVEKVFQFQKPAGIFSKTGAEVDAYSLTHALLNYCAKRETPIFDHTEIVNINYKKRSVELITKDNIKITAKKIVIACGYESGRYLPRKVEKFHSTYAIASEPFATKQQWYKNALIWETAIPYLYLRSTVDNRIVIGGKDEDYYGDKRRDEALPKKALALELAFKKLFPAIPFRTDFKWAGTFASTKDGLPYIGIVPGISHTYFALGYGGNGITFSLLAARILTDLINGKANQDAELFSFNR